MQQVERRYHRRRAGFSLMEIIVVVVIMSLLAGIVGNRVIHYVSRARMNAAKTQIKMLHGAVQSYRLDTGYYPDMSMGLDALVERPPDVTNWAEGGYLDTPTVPVDPWGNPYYYQYPGDYADFDIFTLGRDGVEGGEDEDADIYNSDTGVGATDTEVQ